MKIVSLEVTTEEAGRTETSPLHTDHLLHFFARHVLGELLTMQNDSTMQTEDS